MGLCPKIHGLCKSSDETGETITDVVDIRKEFGHWEIVTAAGLKSDKDHD